MTVSLPTSSESRTGLRRLLVGAAVVLSAMFAMPAVQAIEMPDLYTVEVQIDPLDSESRNDAIHRAMGQVLVRMTGSAYAIESEELAGIFDNPARFVLRYRPGQDNSLRITFDGKAIEGILRQSGHSIWGTERPMTLVWLAVDWGMGEREIIAAASDEDESAARSIDRNRLLRERVMETAEHRGIPVMFPLLDAEDLENIRFSDIWAGFDDRLLAASARYGVTSVLVGRVRTTGLGQNRWTFYFGDELQSWTGQPEQVVNYVADSLAAQFAFSPGSQLETIRLTVSGVETVSAYGTVQRFLNELNLIEDYAIHSVDGADIEYRIRLYGSPERLSRALELSGILERVDADIDPLDFPQASVANGLDFIYRP